MKEGGDIIVMGITHRKLSMISINLICLTLGMMWASQDNEAAFHSAFLRPQTQLLFNLSPPDIYTGFPITVANPTSEPQRTLAIGNTVPTNAPASIDQKQDESKGKELEVEIPVAPAKSLRK